MEALEQFRSIAKSATDQLAQTSNAPDVVPYGKAMLELIAKHPEQRQAFGQAFLQGFRSQEEFDPWLIEFCMHALRWPELKNEFTTMSAQAVARKDWTLIPALGHVLDAFEDGWEDARDFYAEYFGAHGT